MPPSPRWPSSGRRRALNALGPRLVVVKGGHAVTDARGGGVDVVWDDARTVELRSARTATGNDHGTGAPFSSAVAAQLACGGDVVDALRAAEAYVDRAVHGAASWRLGNGHGPLDHLGWTQAGCRVRSVPRELRVPRLRGRQDRPPTVRT